MKAVLTKTTAAPDDAPQLNLVAAGEVGHLSKIAAIKMHASTEMKKFLELTDVYIAELNKMALFESLAESLEISLKDEFYYGILDPIMKNERIQGMNQETFDRMRKTYYGYLVEKYQADRKGKK